MLPLNSVCTSVGVTPIFTCKTGYTRNATNDRNCYGNFIKLKSEIFLSDDLNLGLTQFIVYTDF